jgi:hypothetical protein
MKTTLKQLIKEAILEALLEFTQGGVATVDEEFKEDDKNSGGGDTDSPTEGGGGTDSIPDNGGNDTIPGRPGPVLGPVGFSLR